MNFGIVVFNQVEELDFVGPWEMLTMWSKFADGPANCPPLDYLLIPGGQGTRLEVSNPVLLDFIATQARNCKAVLSVCTGAFVMHAAGLLSGKKATTHWGSLERLRALGDVHVVEQRFVQDGNVWSSAGVSAGTDLMLAFIASVAGEETAGKVQFAAEYYPASKKYGGFENHAQAPAYIKSSGG